MQKRIGHFASQCRTSAHRLRELQQVEDVENNGQLFAIKQMSTIGRAPTISATITSLNGSATLNVLPDTGADITAADLKVLKLLGEDINNLLPPVSGPTSSADGSPLKSLGQLPISISFGEITVNETVQIFPSIQ